MRCARATTRVNLGPASNPVLIPRRREEPLGRLAAKILRGQRPKGLKSVAKMAFRLPEAAQVIENPSSEQVKELAAKMRTARPTKYGNLNIQTEVLARS